MDNHQPQISAASILDCMGRISEILEADITTLNKDEILMRLVCKASTTRALIDVGLKAIQAESELNEGKLNVDQIKALSEFIKKDVGVMTDDLKKVIEAKGDLPEDAEKLVEQIDIALQILPVMIYAAEMRNKQLEADD